MTRNPMRCGPSSRILISIAAAVALAGACSPSGSGGAPGDVPEGQPAADARMAGVLSRPLDSFVGAAGRDSFVAEMRDPAKRWIGGGTHERACIGAGCGSTRVELMGLDGAHLLDLTRVHPNGVVVGRMVNIGTAPESLYVLDPQTSMVAYYLVVQPPDAGDTSPNRRAVLRIVGVPSDPSLGLRIEQRGTRYFNDCDHEENANPRVTEAAFTGCDPTATRADTSAAALALRRAKPGWIACVHGCCEIGVS